MNKENGLERCGEFRVHPSAALLPWMTGDEWADFKQSILDKAGNLEPVVVLGDLLIDGRNRVRADEELRNEGYAVELRKREWVDNGEETITEFIARVNLKRRQLSDDQRTAIATRLEDRIKAERAERQQATRIQPGETRNPHGRKGNPEKAEANSPSPSTEERRERNRKKAANSTVGQIAKMAGVTEHKVKEVKKAIRDGGPEVRERLIRGEVTAKELNRKTRKPKESPDPLKPMELVPFVSKSYRALLEKYPVADRRAVREVLLKLIEDDQRSLGESPSRKRVGVAS